MKRVEAEQTAQDREFLVQVGVGRPLVKGVDAEAGCEGGRCWDVSGKTGGRQ